MRYHAKDQNDSSKNVPVTSSQSFAIFAFSANRRDRRKPNFVSGDFERSSLGFYTT